MTEIRVLAVRQPWASLIVEGLKTIEVRRRNTNIRGKIAIYASRHNPFVSDLDWVYYSLGAQHIIEEMNESDKNKAYSVYEQIQLPNNYGSILGTVEITNSRYIEAGEHATKRREHFAPFTVGSHYWIFANPVRFSSPIPYKAPKGAIIWSKTDLQEDLL